MSRRISEILGFVAILAVGCSSSTDGAGGSGATGGNAGSGGVSGSGGASGAGGATGGSGGSAGSGGTGSNCTVVTRVTGSVTTAAGVGIEAANAGMCIREDVSNADELAFCLTPTPTAADGTFSIDIPQDRNCMQRAAMQVFFFDPLDNAAQRIKLYCDFPVDGLGPEIDVAPYILYDPIPPTDLPPRGDPTVDRDDCQPNEDCVTRTVVFEDGLEIDMEPNNFFAFPGYENLGSVKLDPTAPGLCFVHNPTEITKVYGIRPDGDLFSGVTFPVRIPNSEGLAANSSVALYILGGLAYQLIDDTYIDEGEWVQFGTATVSADGTTIEGGELPYLNWFGYGPLP